MIRNIIFDWSGTLVDDLPAVLAATNYVFAQCGIEPMSLETFRAEFCLPFKNFYDRHLPGTDVVDLEKHFHAHFESVQDNIIALPHAKDFLEFCRRNKIRTFLLSTVSPNYFTRQANAVGFNEYIDKPYAGVWDKREKIVQLITENNLLPEETIFIGDMQHDVETAKFGGIGSCAVLTGYNRLHQLRASNPDVIVEHLGELREILEKNQFQLQSTMELHPISTVGALIYNAKGEVLMVRTQKWSGLWGIPGGKIKLGESSIDALRREIKEETNLNITAIHFELVQDCIHSREFYRDAHFVLLNYTCQTDGAAQVTLNEEAQEFRWVKPSEAFALSLNEPTRILLEHVTHGSNRH